MTTIKSVLVTGATGHIGSAISQELLSHGYQVFALCRTSSSASKATAMGCQIIAGDMAAPAEWISQLDQVDAVIHTACSFDEQMANKDRAFIRAIAAAPTSGSTKLKVIYTTGCWVHGSHTQVISEQVPETPIAAFQWMQTHRDWLFSQPHLNVSAVSPANVVGEAQHFVPEILWFEFERVNQPTVPAMLSATLPLVERRNLAQLYRLAMEAGQPSHTYIGVSDPAVPFSTLVRQISQQPALEHQYGKWQAIYGDWVEGYVLEQTFTSDRAIEQLGWQPTVIYAEHSEGVATPQGSAK